MANAIVMQHNQVAVPFGNLNINTLSTIDEVCETLRRINALKPIIKLLEDAQVKKKQILLAEIAIAKKIVAEFPCELKRVYRSDNKITIAKFWAAQTDTEIDRILQSIKCMEFTGSYREYVRERNAKRIKREKAKIHKSGEIELIEQEVAEQIAKEEIRETIRDKRIEEIEKELDKELEMVRYSAENKAIEEFEQQYKAAVQKVTKNIPRDIKEIKEEIRTKLKKSIEYAGRVDVCQVVKEVVCTRGFYDYEFAELFHQYAASYVKRTYDVCLGVSSINKSTYFLWESATEPQRRADVHNKIALIMGDLKSLSKRSEITRYTEYNYYGYGYEKLLSEIISKIQQEQKSESVI